MKSLITGVVGAVAALLISASAAASYIGPFQLDLTGTYVDIFVPPSTLNIVATTTVTNDPYNLGVTNSLATLNVDLSTGSPFPVTGNFTLSGPGGTLSAVLVGSMYENNVPFGSAAGTFEVTSGSGVYAGLTGQGVFSVFAIFGTNELVVHLGGVLVPAPAVLPLLCLAGAVGTRRRRRH